MTDKQESSGFLHDLFRIILYVTIFAGQCFALSILVELLK